MRNVPHTCQHQYQEQHHVHRLGGGGGHTTLGTYIVIIHNNYGWMANIWYPSEAWRKRVNQPVYILYGMIQTGSITANASHVPDAATIYKYI